MLLHLAARGLAAVVAVAVAVLGLSGCSAGPRADAMLADAAVDLSAQDAPWTLPVDAAGPDLLLPFDLGSGDMKGVLTVLITANSDCTVSTAPPSYAVPAGTTFLVDWINLPTSHVSVNISTDGGVPIDNSLAPGQGFADAGRSWCGTGAKSFNFEVDGCNGAAPQALPIDCAGP